MSDITSPPVAAPATAVAPAIAPPAPPDENDLRLVLFGMPAAGKSSLLGALSQASEAQKLDLGGELLDESQGLARLRYQLYEATPTRTPEEVVGYPVRYTPTGNTKADALDAVLMDCDGRIATDLITKADQLEQKNKGGTLARAVLKADTLILVIDASAPHGQVESNFAEFERFVHTFEQGRKQGAEVAGLPVFLVLTKCDLLARPDHSPADWFDSIEQRKRELDAHFRRFLAREKKPIKPGDSTPPTPSPFGRINLHIWATAVKRPQLAGSPAKPREPYGVAELFRQCLKEANEYRRREQKSEVRLVLITGILGLLLVAMLGLTLGLWLTGQSGQVGLLTSRVEDLRAFGRGTAAERLRGEPSELREQLDRFKAIQEDPHFSHLPKRHQQFIEERIAELQSYIAYYETLRKERPLIVEQSEAGLRNRIQRLEKELKPPHDEWKDTDAGKRYQNLVTAAETLRESIRGAVNWYLESIDEAAKLLTFRVKDEEAGIDWAAWTTKAQELIDVQRRLPFNEKEQLPGDSTVTYGAALRFDRVIEVRASWEADRTKLRRLLDICSALGLATASEDRPPLLVFSRDFTYDKVIDRLAQLKKHYPNYETTFHRTMLPDAIVAKVRQVAGNQYRQLLEPAREEVLRRLLKAGGGKESAAAWDDVRKWLQSPPPDLLAWRDLARALLNLDEPATQDPVRNLADFLGKDEFILAPKSLILEVPNTSRIEPRGGSALFVIRNTFKERLKYTLKGEPRNDSALRVTRYTYELSDGEQLACKPGDKIWAEVALTSGTADEPELLMWADARSSLWTFERLRNGPRVHAPGEALGSGRLADSVRLVIQKDDSVPRVPDLVPKVPAK